MQYLDVTVPNGSQAVNVSSRHHSEVFFPVFALPLFAARVVLTAQNTDNRSHVCSSRVTLVGFCLVPVGSVSIKMRQWL